MRKQATNRVTGRAVGRPLLAFAVAACAVLALSVPSVACEGLPQTATKAELSAALEVRPDGSFVALETSGDRVKGEAGKYYASRVSGGAVKDLGEGRVGQKLSENYDGCSYSEELLFVDCNALEGLMLDGQSIDSKIGGMSANSIAEIQYPKGPIRFGKGYTVERVAAVASKHKIRFTRNLYDHYETMAKKMRYNPYQGCRIFYPDSPGAQR